MAYSDEALMLSSDSENEIRGIIARSEAYYTNPPSPVETASAKIASLFDAPELAPIRPQRPDFVALADASPLVVKSFIDTTILPIGDHMEQIRANDPNAPSGYADSPPTSATVIQFPVLGAHNHEGYKNVT